MNPPIHFSARLAPALFSIALIVSFIYVGQGVFIPVTLALLFAILLRPAVAMLQVRLRFPPVMAVSVTVVFGILIAATVIFLISLLVSDIAGDWEIIKANLLTHYDRLQEWIKGYFGIGFPEQRRFLEKATNDTMGTTFNSFTGTLLNVLLVPFYTFLILLYRNLFIVFVLKVFKDEPQEKIHRILIRVKMSVQSFLVGIMIEMGIVSALTTAGLLIVGMKYALLLGIITGVLNMIPYIGILTAAVITVAATLTGPTDVSGILSVVVVNVAVQIIDNNLLVPMVVSSKVRVNAFVSVTMIFLGGQLLGVAGMFLAIPITAILKVIFDEVDSLEPWGFLIGDSVPKTTEWHHVESSAPAGLLEPEKDAQRYFLRGFLNRISGLFRK